MANNNSFNVINFENTNRPTLETISKDEPAGKARFALKTQNTEKALIQVKLPFLSAGTILNIEISGAARWAADKNEPIHFVEKDPGTNTLKSRKVVYENANENGGDFLPIEYSAAVEKIIIDIEVTGANQETILYIGGGFSSRG